MTITIVADVFGKDNNGTAITARRLIENLKERGYTVRVVSPYESDEEGFYTVPVRNFFIFNHYIASNGVELAKPDRKILREAITGADVVHIMLPFKLGIAACKIAHEMNIPVTAGFHVQPENFSSHVFLKNAKLFNRYLYARFRHKLYRSVPHVHCPSEFIAGQLRGHKYTSKLHVISNGVSPIFVKAPAVRPAGYEGKFLILNTGRFVREKRQDILIRAVALSKHRDDIQIMLAGYGPEEKYLARLARRKGLTLDKRAYKPGELPAVVNYCDLYVHPAEIEIEGIAVLEAITCGLVPVINDSPRSAAGSFALDERSKFDGTPEDLAKKIDYWIEHPDERKAASERYIEYSERFCITKCIDMMEKMFAEAAAGKEKTAQEV